LDAPEKILPLGGAQGREAAGLAGLGRLDRRDRPREHDTGVGGRLRDREHVGQSQNTALRKVFARRHEGLEYRGQEIALLGELRARHPRLRIIPSATCSATAWIVEVGFTPAQVTMTLPSTT